MPSRGPVHRARPHRGSPRSRRQILESRRALVLSIAAAVATLTPPPPGKFLSCFERLGIVVILSAESNRVRVAVLLSAYWLRTFPSALRYSRAP